MFRIYELASLAIDNNKINTFFVCILWFAYFTNVDWKKIKRFSCER